MKQAMPLLLMAVMFSPAVALARAPVGTLTIILHSARGTLPAKKCRAIVLTGDTLLTQASCFDSLRRYMHEERDTYDFEGTFLIDGGTALQRGDCGDIKKFDIQNDYQTIDCRNNSHPDACTKAREFCNHRFAPNPLMRDACLYDSSFYARTFLPDAGTNLALVYLNRRIEADYAPIIEPLQAWHDTSPSLAVVLADGETVVDAQTPRRSAKALTYENFEGARSAQAVWLVSPTGQRGIVALPSHYASLFWDPNKSVDYAFTRVDAAADWIRVTMGAAYSKNRRDYFDVPQRLFFSAAPQKPLPEPRPGPQPAPEPPVNPRPIPSPKPEPVPAPRHVPTPPIVPSPAPEPIAKPTPEAPKPREDSTLPAQGAVCAPVDADADAPLYKTNPGLLRRMGCAQAEPSTLLSIIAPVYLFGRRRRRR